MQIEPKELVELITEVADLAREGATGSTVVNNMSNISPMDLSDRAELRNLRNQDDRNILKSTIEEMRKTNADAMTRLENERDAVSIIAAEKKSLSAALGSMTEQRDAFDHQLKAHGEQYSKLATERDDLKTASDALDDRTQHAEMMVKGLTKDRDAVLEMMRDAMDLVGRAKSKPSRVNGNWQATAINLQNKWEAFTT